MLREDTVFGPIRSRRLGISLGINLLPTKGKFCNFDCIYCECGWNKDGVTSEKLPDSATVRSALEEKLASMLLSGERIDSITFSGDGEPTLNPDFPAIVRDTLKLRDIYFPDIKVCVLSNATTLDKDEVVEALKMVDKPILKLDASDTAGAFLVNQPSGAYDVEKVVRGMEKFKGEFTLQTIFLKSSVFDSSDPENLKGWMDIVRRLHPREIMAYTISRPTPEGDLQRFGREEMKRLLEPLAKEGFNVKIYE